MRRLSDLDLDASDREKLAALSAHDEAALAGLLAASPEAARAYLGDSLYERLVAALPPTDPVDPPGGFGVPVEIEDGPPGD